LQITIWTFVGTILDWSTVIWTTNLISTISIQNKNGSYGVQKSISWTLLDLSRWLETVNHYYILQLSAKYFIYDVTASQRERKLVNKTFNQTKINVKVFGITLRWNTLFIKPGISTMICFTRGCKIVILFWFALDWARRLWQDVAPQRRNGIQVGRFDSTERR
jgi:hypothetical protein